METSIKRANKWECDTLRCRDCDAEQNVECLETYGILTDNVDPTELHAADKTKPPKPPSRKPKKLAVVNTIRTRIRLPKGPIPVPKSSHLKRPTPKPKQAPATKAKKVAEAVDVARKKDGSLKKQSAKLLQSYSRPQLMRIATECGVKGSNRLKSDALREAIVKAQK